MEIFTSSVMMTSKQYSRDSRKRGRANKGLVSPSSSSISTKNEIRGILEDLKYEILDTFTMQMDTIHIKRKREEAERALATFYPRCTKRHPKNECPLDVIEICSVCEENHSTSKFPSFSGLKSIY